MRAILALADGTIFEGEHFGASGETSGEMVFNTSMTGYQEILSDPSYNGQIATMTYPLIGNYGCNNDDIEADRPQVAGFVVREYSSYHSSWRSSFNLDDYLKKHGIIGIQEIDTRALTRRLRSHGVMNGVISTEELDPKSLVRKAKALPELIGIDLAKEVTCAKPYFLKSDCSKFSVVAIDFGIKKNILRQLLKHDCDVKILPANATASQILEFDPDGIFLSNGPGDPRAIGYAIDTIRQLIGEKPIFGICLGHQLLSLAFGAKSYKLKFGHRGGNQPVKRLDTEQIEITAQNHGFCVDRNSLPKTIRETHINLNDQTLAGIEHREYPIFSVQYHPEASPGPHDSNYLFEKFVNLMKNEKNGGISPYEN